MEVHAMINLAKSQLATLKIVQSTAIGEIGAVGKVAQKHVTKEKEFETEKSWFKRNMEENA